MAGLFHPLLCSFCGFTALFPKGTVLLQLLFACLFQGVTLFCVFPVVDRQCLVLARQCRKKKCPVMTCTSGVLLTAAFRLTKSMSHLVLIVISLLILFESCLWILGLPLTLICFLDPRRPTKATLAKRPSKRVTDSG